MKTEANEEAVAGVQLEEIARLHENTLVDEARLASLLGVNPRTVRRMVQRHELPPPIRQGNRCLWITGRVMGFFNTLAESAEKEAARHAKKIAQLT